MFVGIAETTVYDLNALVGELPQKGNFDHKRELKSPTWCKNTTAKLVTQYKKDVARKKAEPIAELFTNCLSDE